MIPYPCHRVFFIILVFAGHALGLYLGAVILAHGLITLAEVELTIRYRLNIVIHPSA